MIDFIKWCFHWDSPIWVHSLAILFSAILFFAVGITWAILVINTKSLVVFISPFAIAIWRMWNEYKKENDG